MCYVGHVVKERDQLETTLCDLILWPLEFWATLLFGKKEPLEYVSRTSRDED